MTIGCTYSKGFLCFAMILLYSGLFSQPTKKFKTPYDRDDLDLVPPPPDYNELKYWIVHPEKEDFGDLVPGKGELKEYQETADVDVFFIYPTIYSGKQDPDHPWFADVNDEKLNKAIAKSTIKNQATAFNASAKVYSPLYRQAHIGVYRIDNLPLKVEALEYAYLDVKRAFEHYLKNWNNGRPIIIASHSQGTNHAVKLLREFFEERPLMNKLVAAYIIGMPLSRATFSYIPICENPEDTGCWITWNTYAKGYYPPDHDFWFDNGLSVNPLSWKTDTTYVSWGENRGGLLRNYKKLRPGLVDAQNMDGMLWINKPRFFGNFLLNWDRYHIADYNLFYLNIRENVADRVAAYLEKQEQKN